MGKIYYLEVENLVEGGIYIEKINDTKLRNVSYRYKGNKMIVMDINLDFNLNKFYPILGERIKKTNII